jgi:threonine aldolase
VHLDGARIWNAHLATGTPFGDYGAVADVFTVGLSKGLGAPVGSLVLGPAEMVAAARVWRKRLGGGWRQAGVLAAAGLYALDHHVERLADDHAHARLLAAACGVDPRASTPTSSWCPATTRVRWCAPLATPASSPGLWGRGRSASSRTWA